MNILFLGEYDSSEIVPAPIKVGKKLFEAFKVSGHHINYLPYFQDGKIYSRIQKLFGFQRIADNVYRTGIFPLVFFVIKFRPQVIHIITPGLYYSVLFPFKKILGFKIVSTLHSINYYVLPKLSDIYGYQRARFLFIEKLLLRCSNSIFVYTERDKRYITKYHKVSPPKIEVVINGITLLKIRKTDFSLGSNLKIAFVGNIKRKEKAFDFLIQTLSKINHPIILSIFNYESQSEEFLPLSSNIKLKFYEPLNEKDFREELKNNDLFIIPSVYESFSISLLEAMNTGIIILASSRVGLTERFGSELNCLVFKYNDEKDLLDHINYVLKMKNETITQLSYKIRDFSKSYSWSSVAENYYQIYKVILVE